MPSPDPLQPLHDCDDRLAALPTPTLLAGARAALQRHHTQIAQGHLRAAVHQPKQSPFIIAFAAYLSTQARAQNPVVVCPREACDWTSTLLSALQHDVTPRHDDAELIALSVQYAQGEWAPRILRRFHLRFSLLLHRAAFVHPETAEVLHALLLPRFRAHGMTDLSAMTLEVIEALQMPMGSGGGGGFPHVNGSGPLFDLHP